LVSEPDPSDVKPLLVRAEHLRSLSPGPRSSAVPLSCFGCNGRRWSLTRGGCGWYSGGTGWRQGDQSSTSAVEAVQLDKSNHHRRKPRIRKAGHFLIITLAYAACGLQSGRVAVRCRSTAALTSITQVRGLPVHGARPPTPVPEAREPDVGGLFRSSSSPTLWRRVVTRYWRASRHSTLPPALTVRGRLPIRVSGSPFQIILGAGEPKRSSSPIPTRTAADPSDTRRDGQRGTPRSHRRNSPRRSSWFRSPGHVCRTGTRLAYPTCPKKPGRPSHGFNLPMKPVLDPAVDEFGYPPCIPPAPNFPNRKVAFNSPRQPDRQRSLALAIPLQPTPGPPSSSRCCLPISITSYGEGTTVGLPQAGQSPGRSNLQGKSTGINALESGCARRSPPPNPRSKP